MNHFKIAYIGLGSNMGNKRGNLIVALDRLAQKEVSVLAVSPLFSTPPWGNVAQDDFVNAVAKVAFDTTAGVLLEKMLETEREMGRVRMEKWGPRIIDLDLLDVPGESILSDSLTLPHPFLEERLFVLLPLAAIAPDYILPHSQVPILARIQSFSEAELAEITALEE